MCALHGHCKIKLKGSQAYITFLFVALQSMYDSLQSLKVLCVFLHCLTNDWDCRNLSKVALFWHICYTGQNCDGVLNGSI